MDIIIIAVISSIIGVLVGTSGDMAKRFSKALFAQARKATHLDREGPEISTHHTPQALIDRSHQVKL